VHRGCCVRAIDGDLSGRERRLEVPLLGVRLEGRVDPGRFVQERVVDAQLDVVGLGRVLDPDEPLRLSGRLVALGDNGGDDLASVGNAARLEQRQLDVVDPMQRRRVLMREDGEDAG
jgi:hypothetical protein